MGRSRRSKSIRVSIKIRENYQIQRAATIERLPQEGSSVIDGRVGHLTQSSDIDVVSMEELLKQISAPLPPQHYMRDPDVWTADPYGSDDDNFQDDEKNTNTKRLLHSALLSCDEERVKNVIKERPELDENLLVSFVKKIKTTAGKKKLNSKIKLFYFAIVKNELEICKYLIDDGAKLKLPRSKYIQPLQYALCYKRYEIARLLVARGADLFTYNTDDVVPMWYAIDDVLTVEHMLRAGFPVNGVIDRRMYYTALHIAAVFGKKELAQTLIKHNADLNVVSKSGLKAIDLAVCQNNPRLVKVLTGHGANPNGLINSTSLLIGAIEMGYGNVVKQLIDAGANIHSGMWKELPIKPIHFAVNHFRPKIVQLLLQRGAEVESMCVTTGKTPLLNAVSKCFKLPKEAEDHLKTTQIVDILLDHGANVSARTKSGAKPLKLAMMADNYDVVRLLLSAGAKCKYSLLVPAVMRGDVNAVKTCLEFGGDYSFLYQGGETIYHQALTRQRPTALSLFWKYGCPFDQSLKSLPGNTHDITPAATNENKAHIIKQRAFIKAIGKNDPKGVLQSLEGGAEPRGCSEAMKSPIHLVAEKGFKNIVKILLERGVAANTVYNKETPLNVAAREGHVEVCVMLLQHGACFNLVQGGGTPLQITGHKKLKKMLKTVKQMFNMTRRGDVEVLRKLEYSAQNNLKFFWALVNAVDHSGHTLMGTALRKGHLKIATGIMTCRLQAEVMCAETSSQTN